MSDVAMAALDHDPRKKPDHAPVPPGGKAIKDWGLAIEAPLHVADPDAHSWDEEADMVVVGLGGAGSRLPCTDWKRA